MTPCTHSSLVSAYYDGELDAASRSAFESHLAGCEACKTELAQLAKISASLRSLPRPTLSASALAHLHRRLDWATPPVALDRWARRLALAACILLMASIGFYTTRQSGASSAADTPVAAAWEVAAVTPEPGRSAAAASTETQVAQWIVTGLENTPHD